jgi:hypothetical protein
LHGRVDCDRGAEFLLRTPKAIAVILPYKPVAFRKSTERDLQRLGSAATRSMDRRFHG